MVSKDLGVGVGLRVPHYRALREAPPRVDFFEAISENFLVDGGKPLRNLDFVLERWPVVLHGVSLSIGGPEPLDRDHLRRLKALVRRTATPWVSDHFCWTRSGGVDHHDLLPLPFTREVVALVAERARQVQDFLEVPFALENTSSYLAWRESTLTEWEFVSEVAERAGIGLLFDLNNVWVSAFNHDFDPYDFLHSVPLERVVQVHLAGHTHCGDHLIDTHVGEPIPEVLALYEDFIQMAGPVSTLLEWDDEIPALEHLLGAAERIREARDRALARREAEGPQVPRGPRPVFRRGPRADGGGWRQGGPADRALPGAAE